MPEEEERRRDDGGQSELVDPNARPSTGPATGGSTWRPMLKKDRSPASGRPVLADDWQPGQTLLDDFAVEGLIGEGGMGKVYLVHSRTSQLAFAVKRAKGLDDSARRNFLNELQTWIDLPEHPNLVACRFFRTMADEVLIFAEYVEGGSLSEWIRSRKLYEGGPKPALERILDVAIQSAWGLHSLHELGLVHQDVKPGNLLMARERSAAVSSVQAKVTDYGLARAKAAGGERNLPGLGQSILVSSGGRTLAYCSPEQAKGISVTRKTDIWSWGVSVLEMFTGEVTWASGQLAAEALEGYLREPQDHSVIPAMPAGVVEVLRGCFWSESSRRWENLAQVVDQLKETYRKIAGVGYHHTLAATEQRTALQMGIEERRGFDGATWVDPREWLEQALLVEGRDPAEAESIASNRPGSRRGELVADLAIYDEARRAHERLVRGGHWELEAKLAILCLNKAIVHETIGDWAGAMSEYDRATELMEHLVLGKGQLELSAGLAKAYVNKARALSSLREKRAATDLNDRAIEIYERLVHKAGRSELADDLAMAYGNKANALRALGNPQAAVEFYDRVIEIRERLVHLEGRLELADGLAMAYMNKALALEALGDLPAAAGLHDRAIELLERLVGGEGRRELANGLAKAYVNKAAASWALGDYQAAIALYDQAIEIRERLFHREGRSELARDLALTYMNKALVVRVIGDHQAAIELHGRAIELLELLGSQESRGELADDLALAYTNKALAVWALGDHRAAVGLYDQAIEIRERLVNWGGRWDLADGLAMAYMNKAKAVSDLGDHRTAVELYDRAIEIRERLVHQEGRRELAGSLAMARANRAVELIDLGEVAKGVKEGREVAEVLRAEAARTGSVQLGWYLEWLARRLSTGE